MIRHLQSAPHRFAAFCMLAVSTLSLHAGETRVLPLAGEWRFELGARSDAFARDLRGRIQLPGTIDDAGLGPENHKAPTLEGPYRKSDYAGPAWYQRDIEIPAGWRGQHVTLFLERCRWVTTVWLDDQRLGTQDSLVAPQVYDLGAGLVPGRHRLTICVDNTVKHDLGRFVSALFGGTWGNMNGIIGRIELAATPPVWIDDVQVYPRLATKSARVKVRIGNVTGQAGRGTLIVGTKRTEVSWDAQGGNTEVDVDLGTAKPWDEFSPNLTELAVKLGDHERSVRFGLREFGAQGSQFVLNGRPIFLRGTLECSIFPRTGYPPTDVAWWQRVYRIVKSYGLNHVRFHSWCPPEAAFAAADIEGVLIQPEGPQANVPAGANPARDAFVEAEFRRIVDTYGNHPSFCTMALGNEFGGSDALLEQWVGMLRARDPRHLYTAASNNRQQPPNRQFTVTPKGRGIHGAATTYDLRAIVAQEGRPVLGHEIGQWMFFPDFNEIPKWSGVMRATNLEMIRDDLARKHLLDLAPKYVAASGAFAVLLYKEEIESLLRTPGYGGFALLDLHDYPTQGTALIGPLDAFWESKGFITPDAFRRFCGATVPLLRLTKRTYTVDEPFSATAELAHFGPADLRGVRPEWSIRDEAGREIARGTLPAVDAATGGVTAIGSISASLAAAAVPARLKVTVALPGTSFANDWDIWVYPPKAAVRPAPDVVVCTEWPAAKLALDQGRKVVLFAGTAPGAMKGRFLPVFWSPVWFPTQRPNTMGLLIDPAHPLFAGFPTAIHSDWQWHELMQHSRLFILDDAPAAYRPTLQVIDNFARNHKLGAIFEARVGRGRLLACGLDLPALPDEPAARQLLASLYAYVGSPAFAPTQSLDAAWLKSVLSPDSTNAIARLGGRIRADNESENNPASSTIDGDPKSIWHTTYDDAPAPLPHELVVEFPKAATLAGVTCLPRQDGNGNGGIRGYAVYVSDDGREWGAPLAQGEFARDANLKEVRFRKPVTARFVRFVALSGFDARPYSSLAEFSILTP